MVDKEAFQWFSEGANLGLSANSARFWEQTYIFSNMRRASDRPHEMNRCVLIYLLLGEYDELIENQ